MELPETSPCFSPSKAIEVPVLSQKWETLNSDQLSPAARRQCLGVICIAEHLTRALSQSTFKTARSTSNPGSVRFCTTIFSQHSAIPTVSVRWHHEVNHRNPSSRRDRCRHPDGRPHRKGYLRLPRRPVHKPQVLLGPRPRRCWCRVHFPYVLFPPRSHFKTSLI
jgi:hypothetical protein